MTKKISLGDVLLIGAINAALVGILNATIGPDNHPAFGEMWWCFFGSLNVWLSAEPGIIKSIWNRKPQ